MRPADLGREPNCARPTRPPRNLSTPRLEPGLVVRRRPRHPIPRCRSRETFLARSACWLGPTQRETSARGRRTWGCGRVCLRPRPSGSHRSYDRGVAEFGEGTREREVVPRAQPGSCAYFDGDTAAAQCGESVADGSLCANGDEDAAGCFEFDRAVAGHAHCGAAGWHRQHRR